VRDTRKVREKAAVSKHIGSTSAGGPQSDGPSEGDRGFMILGSLSPLLAPRRIIASRPDLWGQLQVAGSDTYVLEEEPAACDSPMPTRYPTSCTPSVKGNNPNARSIRESTSAVRRDASVRPPKPHGQTRVRFAVTYLRRGKAISYPVATALLSPLVGRVLECPSLDGRFMPES
jgi:hypothetical protein